MFKTRKIIILIVLMLVSILSLVFLDFKIFHKQNSPPTNSPVSKEEGPEENKGAKTVPETREIILKDEIPGETSVYDFMTKLKDEGKINFADKNYTGMGKLITSINGIASNNKKSWIYYVNGEEAEVGVSNYKINEGDIITWRLE